MSLSLYRSLSLTGCLLALALLVLFFFWSPAIQPQQPATLQDTLPAPSGVLAHALPDAIPPDPIPVGAPGTLGQHLASIAPTIRTAPGDASDDPLEPAPGSDASRPSKPGELRILWAADAPAGLSSDRDRREVVALLESYAEQQFLIPTFVPVPSRHDLIPALEAGLGDIIGTPLAPEYLSERGVEPSLPVGHNLEVLVTRSRTGLEIPIDLAGKRLALPPHSPFWRMAPGWIRELRSRGLADLELVALDAPQRTATVLDRLLDFQFDVVSVRVPRRGLDGLQRRGTTVHTRHTVDRRPSFGLSDRRPELIRTINAFLNHEELARRAHERYKSDLPGIQQRKVLRVLTRNNSTDYFIWKGQLLGFEYEMVQRFAESLNVSIEMIVVSTRAELNQALLRGEGDMIAAGLTVQNAHSIDGIEYTRPYDWVRQQVIGRAGDPARGLDDLADKAILVHKSSAAWRRLAAERELAGARYLLEPANERDEVEELIEQVASGQSDYTIADSNVAGAALRWRDDVRVVHEFKGEVPHAWAVRSDSPALRDALNEFLEQEDRSLFFNLTYGKYFHNGMLLKQHAPMMSRGHDTPGDLSPYDDIVKRVAAEYDFDWSLLVAVMYRESRFDPVARSWAGAEGLMQVLPKTARHFGVNNLTEPENGITAGVRMLDWLYERLEADLPIQERTWFALAAYNAGLGHLRDARELAAEMGLDPNRWFDHVEKAMLLLSRPEYYRRARHGFVRGNEPVNYVRDIRKLYRAYRNMG
ncbi:MAG: transporter substrate-binding domain-containing protein [Gammaproteobacteria bacterium]|nr:transporter substrate-binding domain-containing protein [Gammaproteobacteria bacterium]